MYKEVLFMKLKDLLLVADCNYHVFFKTEIANISGLPYEYSTHSEPHRPALRATRSIM